MFATAVKRAVYHVKPEHRCHYLHTSVPRRLLSKQANTLPETRDYFYDIDQHGQLFLSNTKIRNFTSCYKDPAFLDFFYKRLKPLGTSERDETDHSETAKKLKDEGYTFLSLCGAERNYIRSQDTPIVFRELVQQDESWILKYAGTLTTPFQPGALKVDPRGYLYHPSPDATPARRRKTNATTTDAFSKPNSYGAYSLLRSELVISHFGKSLEMHDDGGGSYEWLGSRRDIGLLEDDEASLGKGWVD